MFLMMLVFLLLSLVAIHYLPVSNSTPRNLSMIQWCVPILTATNAQLQANIDWGCSCQGQVDCKPIQPGGACFEPNTLRNHASFVMNTYYHNHNCTDEACSFNNTGFFIFTDPSYSEKCMIG